MYEDILPEVAQIAYRFINKVLESHQVEGAYGALISAKMKDGTFTPAIRIGIPGGTIGDMQPDELFPHPIFIIDDAMSQGAGKSWDGYVQDTGFGIGKGSIGVEGDTTEGGSFGCFLADENDRQYGLSCAHVFENKKTNSRVVCPSSKEITNRFKNIVRYSSICTPEERLGYRTARDREAHEILSNYSSTIDEEKGVAIVRPGNTEVERVVFSGRVEGVNIKASFGTMDVSNEHQVRLDSMGLGRIHFPEECFNLRSRKDFAVFEVM